jgi:hypothetical protein
MSIARCVGPTILVLVSGAATLAGLSGASYYLGHADKHDAPELRFLNPRRAPTVDEACLTFVGEYAVRSHEANDVIFLGDSACRCDIDPLAFERLTGLRAYNLGTFGTSGPNLLAVTAESYLSNHPRPRAVVLCLVPLSLRYAAQQQAGSVQSRFAEAYASPEARAGGVDERWGLDSIARVMRRGAGLAAVELQRLGNGETTDALSLPLLGMSTATYSSLRERLRAQHGRWVLSGQNQANAPAAVAGPKHPGFVSPDWDRGLDEIAQLCRLNRIPLVLRVAPMRPDVALADDFSQAERCLQAARIRNPTVVLKLPVLLYFAWTRCWDPMHLNEKGAEEFTSIVARDVAEELRVHEASDHRNSSRIDRS